MPDQAMTNVIEVPCSCRLLHLLDPRWEGIPCACSGPRRVMSSDGRAAMVALVEDPHATPPPTLDQRLAEFILAPRELGLTDWIAEVRRRAQEVLEP